MKIRKGNIFLPPANPVPGAEIFEKILCTPGLLVERIISTGQSTPSGEWYDQERDEWVVLLTGEATLKFEDGESITMSAGDHLLIPARCRHRVEATSNQPPCIWLAIHGDLEGHQNRQLH